MVSAYQYIMSQNLDQKIDEPFSALSNFNDMAISSFETAEVFSVFLPIKWVKKNSMITEILYCRKYRSRNKS